MPQSVEEIPCPHCINGKVYDPACCGLFIDGLCCDFEIAKESECDQCQGTGLAIHNPREPGIEIDYENLMF